MLSRCAQPHPGLLSRGSTAPLVALAPLPAPAPPRRAPVLALYADSTLRVWDLDRHAALAAAPLPQLPQLAGTRPVALNVATDQGQVLLGVQHRRGEDVTTASSMFSVHTLQEDGHGYRLAARCVVAQALVGVVSSCVRASGGVWALCASEQGPQVC